MTEKDFLIYVIRMLDEGLTKLKELSKPLEYLDLDLLSDEEKKVYFNSIETTIGLINKRRDSQKLLLSKYGILIPNEWES